MKLFDVPISIIPKNPNTCKTCKYNQAWQCNSKVFHYCGIKRSPLTVNGLLKIKCKSTACDLYEKKLYEKES